MSRLQSNKEGEAPASNRRSKVTSERVALLVVGALLAAAAIVIYRLSFDNFQTKKNLQILKDEYEALRKNLTVTTTQHKCPKPTEVKIMSSVDDHGNDESCPQCLEGWKLHGGKCYYFSNDTLTWTQSREECRRRGGDLVKIDSREEQSFLADRLKDKMNKDEDRFWIGLTDSKKEGTWLWVDDSPLKICLSFWYGTEPDNWKGQNPEGENCATIGARGGAENLKCWFDLSCKEPQRSICEKAAETGSGSHMFKIKFIEN